MNQNNLRYTRQMTIPEIGSIGQHNLRQAKVLFVGAGGLCSPGALYLAAAGVGTIGLIDHDVIDTSNLQRQILFRTGDEGYQKVTKAAEHLKSLNPDTTVLTYNEPLSERNAMDLIPRFDLIIDGTDNFGTKYFINDACSYFGKPWVYGAVSGFGGHAAIFRPKQGPCYRCLFPTEPQAKIQNCAESGVMGPIVGIAGSLQATLALEHLISLGTRSHPLCPEYNTLMTFELKGAPSFRCLRISKVPTCISCSAPPTPMPFPVLRMNSCSVLPKSISPSHLQTLIQNGRVNDLGIKQTCIFDVRERSEWDQGHIDNAIHLPLSAIKEGTFHPEMEKSKTYIVYCRSGVRSAHAIDLLSKIGISNLLNLEGGWLAWSQLPSHSSESF